MPSTFYIDYENGDDANAGDSFAAGHPWKTITSGATAARIAPGDTIRIAKSPAPTPLAGTTATWTNLSKTVTLNTAETANIEMCEADWTEVNATSSDKIGTDWKEGTYALKMVEDATPVNDEVQCYSDLYTHDTTVHNLSGYQKISFWIKNEVAILANQLEINLCSNADGTGDVDTFAIPAIPLSGQWVPLTIARTGGGNLGSAIKSINISNGSNTTEYTASKYVYFDNIIACTTNGLNLQSLISKNANEQSSTASANASEGWYGIQSINGTTVLLDNGAATLANAGRGYSTTGTSPETVNTYKRETIKTTMKSGAADIVQEIMDSGTYGNNIQFQGGYDTGTGEQTGETFFDGLNGTGYGIYSSGKSFFTTAHIGTFRYYEGTKLASNSNNNNISIPDSNNNRTRGVAFQGHNNTITIINANNNTTQGVYFSSSANNTIDNIINANNNITYGINLATDNCSENLFKNITNINNNGSYGIYPGDNPNLRILALQSAVGNATGNIDVSYGYTYINNGSLAADPTNYINFSNPKVFVNNLNATGYSKIYTDGGNIISQASTLSNGSGTEWKFTTETNTNRQLNYPLKLTIAKIAVVADKEVTVTCYFKKGHATNIGARLVFPAQLGEVEHYATCPDDTNENNLSIAFTPTEAGVIEIEAWAYYIAGHSTVIVDAMAITQAD